MFTVVKVKRTGQLLWLSELGTYNDKLCEFIGHSKTKGEMPK